MDIWEILDELGRQNLTCLEFYFAFEALKWFEHSEKLDLPTAEELALGARTYTKRFQENGLMPFFIRKEAAHQLTFWSRVTVLSAEKRYLPRII